jgi:hypothetical protein
VAVEPKNFVELIIAFAIFLLPGYLLARVLHEESRAIAADLASGFVYASAVFAIPAWPCLWLGLRSETFWWILAAVWPLFVAVTIFLGRSARAAAVLEKTSGDDDPGRNSRLLPGRVALCLVLVYAAWASVLAIWMRAGLNHENVLPFDERLVVLACLAIGLVVAYELRALPRLEIRPRDKLAAASHRLIAGLFVAVLVVGAALVARPDWDDADYLSTVRQYCETGPLNREAASLRGERLPVAPHMRLLAWELLGATLCRVSTLHPMVTPLSRWRSRASPSTGWSAAASMTHRGTIC